MTEPDVTLTDYALAITGVILLILMQRGHSREQTRSRDQRHAENLRFWFSMFFASVAAASLCGGTVHGFFLDEQTTGHVILWRATLLANGLTALSTWAIAAELLVSPRVARWVLVAAYVQWGLYCIIALFLSQEYQIAVIAMFPAFLFLLVTLALMHQRMAPATLLLTGAGPVLILVAGVLQQMNVGIHRVYFNHNALYHVLAWIALCLFFLGGRKLIIAETRGTAQASSGDQHHADTP